MAVLTADRLYRFYHVDDVEVLALRGVSLEVAPGELVVVSGPSGSGKSTLLACLGGLDEPDGGTVSVAGERLTRRSEQERAALRARHIGVLFQAGNLIDHLDLAGNITVAQSLAGNHDPRPVADLLAAVGLGERADALPSQLSGGERARAGLAVAVANDPEVVLADEPTGEVDSVAEQQVLELLRSHAERGAGVIIVSHSRAVVAAADRRVTLADGVATDADVQLQGAQT